MHARVAGAGADAARPAIVLVHGLVISSLYMVPLAERLAGTFHVLAPDLPGFGRSAKPARVLDIRALADALAEWMAACRLGPAILVGNSLGCQVIVDLLARRLHPAVGAVLGGPTIDPAARTVLGQMGRAVLDVPRERLSLFPHWAADFLRAGPRRALVSLQHAVADRIEESLPVVRVPTLVVRGARDPLVSQAWAVRTADLLPNGRLAVVPGGSHAAHYTNVDAFAPLVQAFAAECAGEARVARPPLTAERTS